MKNFKLFVLIVAVIVLLICVYSFLLGNNVFEGEFENDALGWYFLAKGLFCSLSLLSISSNSRYIEKITNERFLKQGVLLF